MRTTDDNATTWRDLADQLTAEQAARFERHEAQALESIRQGRNAYESPEDITRCFLDEARWEAQQNLTDALFDVPMPAFAESVEHWEDDGRGSWSRRVDGPHRTIDGADASVYVQGVQTPDGTVDWSLWVTVSDRDNMTAEQARTLAATLVEAADELDRLA